MVLEGTHKRIVLRVLKFLKPPNPGDEVVQKEGELLKQYDIAAKVERVWKARSDTRFITVVAEDLGGCIPFQSLRPPPYLLSDFPLQSFPVQVRPSSRPICTHPVPDRSTPHYTTLSPRR